MASLDSEVTGLMLACGLLEAHDCAIAEGRAIQQDASMPAVLRRALARLSAHCLLEAAPDAGASLHVAMDLACEPFAGWGIGAFGADYPFRDVNLIDREAGVPTEDCREMAARGGSEVAADEEVQFRRLRAALDTVSGRRREAAYTAVREFVVRNPVVRRNARDEFITEHDLLAALPLMDSVYHRIPNSARADGAVRLCGGCGSLLWPHRDTSLHPHGRCRIRQCQQANPAAEPGPAVGDPEEWLAVVPSAAIFWVGPGLDEIRIHDALKAAGRASVLYPMMDAADVGVDGTAVGIDVKSYASPLLLASKLTRGVGRLSMFRRRILAVPDGKLALNRNYLHQLVAQYQGETPLEFMTVSSAIRALSR
ncbi:hypothetical protein QMO56_09210 [Roseomonas sp. E05]|uniref:restriction endonuclease-related protein n=1 Tax=Roseomonas sp. E05 TaxID=3046310 RepID=UPI0024BB39EE|nr:hypothetical protein [Roseomonas sp. E05]MDJ0388291.1 hypothetical protein [Roseomonas sp. E05]